MLFTSNTLEMVNNKSIKNTCQANTDRKKASIPKLIGNNTEFMVKQLKKISTIINYKPVQELMNPQQ